MRAKLIFSAACTALAAIGISQNFVASSDNWGYQGSMTKYGSLTDLVTHQNAGATSTFSRRDGSLYEIQNRPDFDTSAPNANEFLTAWYYTTAANTNSLPKDDPNGDRYYSGFGNPNNNTDSFVQLADLTGVTRSTAIGQWTDGTYTSFSLNVTGSLATYGNSLSRLWNGQPAGPAEPTHGTFLSYALNVTFSGLTGVLGGDGYVTSTNEPTSVSGTFNAIFQNMSTTDPSSNGFYDVHLTLDQSQQVWALQQGNAALNGDFFTSTFSAAPVPEPATLSALGLGALALVRRRRARRS